MAKFVKIQGMRGDFLPEIEKQAERENLEILEISNEGNIPGNVKFSIKGKITDVENYIRKYYDMTLGSYLTTVEDAYTNATIYEQEN